MKTSASIQTVGVCLLLMIGFAAGAAAPFSVTPVSPRSVTVSAKAELPLVRQGKPLFRVYVPPKAPASVRNAASDFARLLSEISGGARITAESRIPAGFSGPCFCIGDGALAAELEVDLRALDRDGFVIKTAGGKKILIAGSDAVLPGSGNGTRFGCYEFLERFAGVRFYFPGPLGTVVPVKKEWSLPQITIFDRPDSLFRVIYWPAPGGAKPGWYDPRTENLWRGELALHEKHLRLSTLALPNCHGLAQLGYVQRFAKSHPEYFALKSDGSRCDGSVVRVPSDASGHLCFSSGIMEEIFQDAKAILTGQPASSRNVILRDGSCRWIHHNRNFFNLMPNDSMARCRCKKCAPYFEGLSAGGGYSEKAADFLWTRLLTIPKRLKKEGVPGFVTMMAYDLNRFPPKEKMPDNVLIQVATTGPWLEGRPEQKKDDELILRWVKTMGNSKIYMWNYPTKCTVKELPLIPNHTPESIGAYYRRMFPYSFGTMLNASSDYWFFGHLNFYVFSKVMWDHDTDVEALLKEYFSTLFGKGAPFMAKVSRILERHWIDDICGNKVETSYGPVTYPPSELKLWTQIFSAAEVDRIEDLFAQAEKAAAGDKRALERIRLWKAAMWTPTAEGRRRWFGDRRAAEEWTAPMISVKPGEKLTWAGVPKVALFPIKGGPAEVQTFVQMRCDDKFFYFRFDCREPFTDLMAASPRKFEDRDVWRDNSVEIHIDTEGKRKTEYQIIVNSCGSVGDLRNTPANLGEEWNWNSGAEARTAVTPGKGWIAEIKIPRSGMAPVSNGKFHINFSRHRSLKGKNVTPYYCWSPFAKTFADLANFGTGLIDPKGNKNLFSDPDFAETGVKGAKAPRWYGALPERDEKIFRTAGVAMRFSGKHSELVHRVPIKPGTRYRLSFWLKMDRVALLPGTRITDGGFYLRIDEGGKAHYFPWPAYLGTLPWQRLEHTWKTGDAIGKSYRPYIHFTLRKCSGTAWVDHVELTELPK